MVGRFGGRVVRGFGRFMIRRLVVFGVFGFTRVSDISNIATVSVNGVSHSLGTTVGKEDTVVSVGSITITVFFSSKVNWGITVAVLNGISVVVSRGSIFVFGFMVRRCGLVRRSRLVDGFGGGFVGRGRGRFVGGGRGRLVGWGRFVDNRGVVDYWFVVDNRGMMNRSMMNRGVVNGSVVSWGMVGCVMA